MKIHNIGYKSANYYLIDTGTHRIAIDAGWPGTLNDYGREMRKTGYQVRDIDYLIVTHFHPDHAGLVQELKNQGIRFIIFDLQIPCIERMEKIIRKSMEYRPINLGDNIPMKIPETRDFLNSLGFEGQVLHTPGHSDDSVTVILDGGAAFTGDLQPEDRIMDNDILSRESWTKIRELGGKQIYPGHGFSYKLADE